MPRQLDLTALRSFAAVADSGGVTRAALQLNLTQSAVSMQLKRLEESLGLALLNRSARTIALTAQGEQLLAYARRLLALNDEAWGRLTHPAFEGTLDFGVPHDIIFPHVPVVLQRFAAEYPRVKLQLHSLYTSGLREMLARGEMDIILTTESSVDPGGETLRREALVWAGAPGGQAWRARPLRFASCAHCVFKRPALEALEAAGIPWEIAVEIDLDGGDRRHGRGRPRGQRADGKRRAVTLRAGAPWRRAAAAAGPPGQHVHCPGAPRGARRAAGGVPATVLRRGGKPRGGVS
ncbi:LysR family transcriptional regulator [Amaricoccus sp.]|uniref:LysR family transcriptional regulator n=1 Tax=Amaricoccus sp. TaxID=1872485 RepID=UPI0039E2FDFB